MNLKKVGLAAILSSAFAFVACDNSVAANTDTTAVESQPALSSESTGGDTVTSSEDVDLFASSASIASSAATGTDTPVASSSSAISYANDPVTSSSSVAGDAGGFGGGDAGGFGGGDMGGFGGGDMGGFGGGGMGGFGGGDMGGFGGGDMGGFGGGDMGGFGGGGMGPHYPTNGSVIHFGVSWPFFN